MTAGRLAAADPSLRILLVEAGPHVLEDPASVQPARFLSNLSPGTRTVKFVVSHPSEHLGGRPVVVPSGQCIGGGSSVNCKLNMSSRLPPPPSTHCLVVTVFNRAAPSEYDDWETKYDNPRWGYKDLLPLLKKVCCISDMPVSVSV